MNRAWGNRIDTNTVSSQCNGKSAGVGLESRLARPVVDFKGIVLGGICADVYYGTLFQET